MQHIFNQTTHRLRLNDFLRCLALLVLVAGVVGVAWADVRNDEREALLQRQFVQADRQVADAGAAARGRIILAAFGMNDTSTAFRLDVLTTERAVRALDANAIVFRLVNAEQLVPLWPAANRDTMTRTLAKVAAVARPIDKVVVMLSTHGNDGVLAIENDGEAAPLLRGNELRTMLAPLRGQPTLLLLSACYSGSLIAQLKAPERIILTAAAADRSSFGCEPLSTNTYFIDALLNQRGVGDRSIDSLMDRAKVDIARLSLIHI